MLYDRHEALSASVIKPKGDFIRKPGLSIGIRGFRFGAVQSILGFFKYVFVEAINIHGKKYKVQMTHF